MLSRSIIQLLDLDSPRLSRSVLLFSNYSSYLTTTQVLWAWGPAHVSWLSGEHELLILTQEMMRVRKAETQLGRDLGLASGPRADPTWVLTELVGHPEAVMLAISFRMAVGVKQEIEMINQHDFITSMLVGLKPRNHQAINQRGTAGHVQFGFTRAPALVDGRSCPLSTHAHGNKVGLRQQICCPVLFWNLNNLIPSLKPDNSQLLLIFA